MEINGKAALSTPCEPCLKGKQTHAEIHKTTDTHANTVLGRVFSDVCGKLATRSHHGFEYFMTITDDKSHKVFVTGLHQKSKVVRHLKVFIARAELETGQRLKVLRSDGGGEYTGRELGKYLEEKGIQHEITTPDTPQHNGVAERMNRTLLDNVQAMLLDANLPESYWHDALEYAAHLHNVIPTQALGDVTPEKAWSGNKPNVSRLRVFSTQAFVHIPDTHRGKLAAKLLVCTFLGHAQNRCAYCLVYHHPAASLNPATSSSMKGAQQPKLHSSALSSNPTTPRQQMQKQGARKLTAARQPMRGQGALKQPTPMQEMLERQGAHQKVTRR